MPDLRRSKGLQNKKTISIFAGEFTHGEFDGTEPLMLADLPVGILVVRSHVEVTEASNAGITLDVLLGTTVINNDANIATAGVVTDETARSFPTGGVLSIRPSGALTAGRIIVYVEYLEGELSVNKLTNI